MPRASSWSLDGFIYTARIFTPVVIMTVSREQYQYIRALNGWPKRETENDFRRVLFYLTDDVWTPTFFVPLASCGET